MNTWAIVELMGHQRTLGYVTEVTVAGVGFLRIETPSVDGREAGECIVQPTSIYRITPTTEERVKEALAPYRPIAALGRSDDEDDEDEGEGDEDWDDGQ